jgi:uncharacterized membrane protein (UPF0136 family)
MNWLQAALVAYGLLNIVLGVLAYSKSPVSLYAGGGAGALAILAAFLAKPYPKVGYILGALVCIALLGRFVPKLMQEFQLYPGFVIALASAVMLILLVVGHFHPPK